MAGIEKVCEFTKEGHWNYYDESEPDYFSLNENGKYNYQDNIQVCPEHREELKRLFKGKKHEIVLEKSEFTANEFYLKVEGVPCPFNNEDYWMRWYHDKRRWKRNMRKLLSVKRLNIVKEFSF